MVSNAIVVAQPRQQVGLLLAQANQILYLKQQFKKNVHYGAPYPGSKKDTLLKPGAELLARRFGLRPRYDQLQADMIINWDQPERSYIMYRYRCVMVDIVSGSEVGEAIGSCTSLEDKYRYRSAERVCPNCGKAAIIKGKAEFGGGWLCFQKKEGCGAKFKENDPAIMEQETGKAVNLNPFDLLNTIDKMAQKRAFTSAVLVATGASSYFTPGDEEVNDLYQVAADDIDVVDGVFEAADETGSFPDDIVLNVQSTPPARQQQNQNKPAPTQPVKQSAAAPAPAQNATEVTPEKVKTHLISGERKTNDRGAYMVFKTQNGETVFVYTRQMFKDALWIAENDWSTDGVLKLPAMIPVTLLKNVKGYWEIESVEPMKAPTDQPAQPRKGMPEAPPKPAGQVNPLWFADAETIADIKIATGWLPDEAAKVINPAYTAMDFADKEAFLKAWERKAQGDEIPF